MLPELVVILFVSCIPGVECRQEPPLPFGDEPNALLMCNRAGSQERLVEWQAMHPDRHITSVRCIPANRVPKNA